MNKLLATFIASAATFALASVASAEQVITLTDAELDGLTAAGAFASADLTGDGIVFGAFLLGNLRSVGPFAGIVAAVIPISGLVTLELKAAVEP
jgi:hypothetical protein